MLLDEATAPQMAKAIEHASPRLLSAANLLEATIVIETRKGEAGGRAEIARSAWRRFGKGRHPAALNYGDCFAYALAKSRRAPLLFVGDDFAQTDIECALAP